MAKQSMAHICYNTQGPGAAPGMVQILAIIRYGSIIIVKPRYNLSTWAGHKRTLAPCTPDGGYYHGLIKVQKTNSLGLIPRETAEIQRNYSYQLIGAYPG